MLFRSSHITGGGIAENTARVIPNGLSAIYERNTWTLPVEMEFMAQMGEITQNDMERAWNCGIGMAAIVDSDSADLAIRSLSARGMKAWICGEVVNAPNSTLKSELKGNYRS